MIKTALVSPYSDAPARVTRYGQLVVSPLDYSTPVLKSLAVDGQIYMFVAPVSGHQIVITDVIASADKNVSNADPGSTRLVYSDSPSAELNPVVILSPQLLRGGNFSATGLNFLIPSGKWLIASTNDAAVQLTVGYYRVPAEDV